MGLILMGIGIITLVFAAIRTANELERKGYTMEDKKMGRVPTDGTVVSKFTSLVGLIAWGLLVTGGIIFISNFF